MSLYDVVIGCYDGLMRCVAPWHQRAGLLIQGRKESWRRLSAWRSANSEATVIWFHCASLGEFEQGRPLMDACAVQLPEYKVVLTFYSPSGYEVRKNYAGADLVLYLPEDRSSAMRRWVAQLNPAAAVVIKYEVWPNLFAALRHKKTPLIMASAIFRPHQRYFGFFSSFWKEVLSAVTHFHVQDKESQVALNSIGISAVTVSGDTRFDRVMQGKTTTVIGERWKNWAEGQQIIAGGSTYSDEEYIVYRLLQKPGNWKAVIAPHHIDEHRIREIEKTFDGKTVRASEWDGEGDPTVVILNTMGELSGVYAIASIAIVGGGFGKGIHNTLEPAVHGLAVAFGPKHHAFAEAQRLLQEGGARSGKTKEELIQIMSQWMINPALRKKAGMQAQRTVEEGLGAEKSVMATLAAVLQGRIK